MKTQEREARAARIEYLEEQLSKVCDLIKFVEGENPDKDFEGLMLLEDGDYRSLVKLQVAIFSKIRSMELEAIAFSNRGKSDWLNL